MGSRPIWGKLAFVTERLNVKPKWGLDNNDSDVEKDELTHSDRRPVSPNDKAFADSEGEEEEDGLASGSGVPTFQGHFAFYAQIEFHGINPTRLCYNGLDVPVTEFFRKEGWSSYGR